MPRYFFNVHDGRDIPDHEGTELANDDDARAEAVVAAGAMLRDMGRDFWDGTEWSMQVTDDEGTTVCTLRFSAEA